MVEDPLCSDRVYRNSSKIAFYPPVNERVMNARAAAEFPLGSKPAPLFGRELDTWIFIVRRGKASRIYFPS